MSAHSFLSFLLVSAFVGGVSLTSGYFIGPEPVGVALRTIGWAFMFFFFGIAIVGTLQLRRAWKKQRRYERSMKGLSWRQ